MTKSLTTTLAAGAAVLGLAAPALGQTPLPLPSDRSHTIVTVRVIGEKQVDGRRALVTENVRATMAMKADPKLVPAGKVQHTVVVRKVEGSRAAASHERTEQWLSRTHSRTVVTNVETGKLRTEIVTSPTETRIYDAERNQLRIRSHERQAPPYNAAAFEAAQQRSYLEDGVTRVIGEKLVGGRRALVVESVPGRWRSSESESRTVATVDAETFALYERTTGLPGGAFSQTEVHELTELLPASARAAKARLAMAEHRGAKVKRR